MEEQSYRFAALGRTEPGPRRKKAWLHNSCARREKQHGSIPKKEVMPHEIAAAGSCVVPNKTGMCKKTRG
jgi:hypothetical protein